MAMRCGFKKVEGVLKRGLILRDCATFEECAEGGDLLRIEEGDVGEGTLFDLAVLTIRFADEMGGGLDLRTWL